MFSLHNAALALLASSVGLTFALEPITVQGPNFLDKDGKRFKIVGVDYQPGGEAGYNPDAGVDVLSNATHCKRDAALMQKLGINTLRVYNLDPTVNHDECMSIFNAVGIYAMLDVNSPFESLYRENTEESYTEAYLTRIFGMVENFKAFPNLLGFFASNEVIDKLKTAEETPPFIRAVIRDLKNYIANHADRKIPVGYSAADVRDVLEDTWNYLQCSMGGDDPSQSDFFGLNSYSWCGNSDLQKSGYGKLNALFSKSAIPVFFSEYGCNEVQPRLFTEVPALYSDGMQDFSGGLVYQWTQDENDYGLLKLDEETGTIELMVDFETLQSQYNSVEPRNLAAGPPRNMNAQRPKCSEGLITHKGFSTQFKLPPPPRGGDELIKNGIPQQAAHRGKLVDIGSNTVELQAFTSSGDRIEPFEINPLPSGEINTPSGGDIVSENEGNGGAPSGEDDEDAAMGGRAMAEFAVTGGSLLALAVAVFGMF